MLTADLLGNTPVPVWLVRLPAEKAEESLRGSGLDLMLKIDHELSHCHFRAVGLDRLHDVIRMGIDVTPTDSPIYASFLSKAIEYGGWPKVLLALDPGQLDRTFREVDASLTESEIALLKQNFPTMLKSADGSKLWLSRLKEGDRRVGSSYEIEYSCWIPGDPFKALKAIFLCASETDLPQLLAVLTQSE